MLSRKLSEELDGYQYEMNAYIKKVEKMEDQLEVKDEEIKKLKEILEKNNIPYRMIMLGIA